MPPENYKEDDHPALHLIAFDKTCWTATLTRQTHLLLSMNLLFTTAIFGACMTLGSASQAPPPQAPDAVKDYKLPDAAKTVKAKLEYIEGIHTENGKIHDATDNQDDKKKPELEKKKLADTFDYLIVVDGVRQAGGDDKKALEWSAISADLTDKTAVNLVESLYAKDIKNEDKNAAAATILSNFKKHKDALVEEFTKESDAEKRRAAYEKVINSWDLITIGLIVAGGVAAVALVGGIGFYFYRRSQKTF